MKRITAILLALMLTAGSAVMASAAETAEESVAAEATAEQTAAAAVSLSANSALLGVGESLTLTATAADGAAVSWESSDTAVVTVSEGVLTATGSGKATVTAATETGTAACVVTVQPAPMGISLNSEDVTLGVNEKFDIDVSYTNPDCVRKTYYAVDNTGVAAVNPYNGVVTAKAEGTAIVRAYTYNGLEKTCAVTVKAAPASVSLNANSLLLGVGEAYTLTGTLPSGSASNQTKFASSDSSVAAVSQNGAITAKKAGKANITFTAYNGKSAACAVTVQPAPKGIKLNKTSAELGVGEQVDLNVIYANADAVRKTYYEISPSALADINKNNGVVTAKAVGVATARAYTYNGLEAKCTVNIKPAPAGMSLNAYEKTLRVGETFDIDITYSNPECIHRGYYSSGNTAVATVNAYNGVITAKKAGTATITAYTYNGLKKTFALTVQAPPSSVGLSVGSATYGVGETGKIDVEFNPGERTDNYTLTSDNPKVMSIDKKGNIKALAAGYATITVKTYNGKTARSFITVKKAPAKVAFTNTSVVMQVGETLPMFLSSVNSSEGMRTATYVSSNSRVAAVSSGCYVTAKAEGTATVTATSYNGKTAKVTITVKNQTGYTKRTTTAATTLRTDAGWKYGASVTVPKGATVYQYATSTDGRWYKVKYGSRYGWMYNKAFGVLKNYSSISTTTLPAVADDLIFDLGASTKAIYDFCQDSIRYRISGESSIEAMAAEALKTRKGACYQKAAVLYYLLSRTGNQMIYVSGDDILTGNTHRWCIIKTASGWRHIDPTQVITMYKTLPRYYLVKDSDLTYFKWDKTKYPAAN